MPELKDLVRDIYKLFDEDTHHEPSEENLRKLGDGVIEVVKRRLAIREDSDVLRFSALGRPARQLWYMANRPREKMRSQTLLKFLYGDLVEQFVLFLCRESGHTITDEQSEVDCDGVKGHLDCVIDDVTVDIKSASPFSFKKFETGDLFTDDPFGYIGQISGYANVRTPETGGAFLAADKVHGDLAILEVPASVCQQFDVRARVDSLRDVLSLDTPPERCYPDVPEGESGNRKLGLNCGYCGFKEECWKDSNNGQGLRTFIYSRGPVYLTNVAKLPKVPEAM